MEDENVSAVPAIIGGLPELLLGPAGKALSRLVGAGIDVIGAAAFGIPAAKLRSISQGIEDHTAAKSTITKALADAAAKQAVSDPEIVARSLAQWADKTIVEQARKEKIAEKVIEQLIEEPPAADTGPVDEDWLSIFERQAAAASSERLQATFARVLAGEIRKPGSISLMTLQFLNIIDQQVAQAINDLMPWSYHQRMLLPSATDRARFKQSSLLRDAGLIGQLTADMSMSNEVPEKRYFTAFFGGGVLKLSGKPGTKIVVSGIGLSRVAQELFSVLAVGRDQAAIDEAKQTFFANPAISELRYGELARGGTSTFSELLFSR